MKKAFTLVEVLCVAAIIGILITATTVTFNNVWRNNQTDTCESELRDISSGLKSYLTDYGNIVIKNDMNYEAVINEVVDTMNRQYLPYTVQVDSIADDKKSVKLSAKIKTDPWGGKYQLSVYTYDGSDKDNIPGLVIISSSGTDGKRSAATYKSGNYGDDIIAVVEPK